MIENKTVAGTTPASDYSARFLRWARWVLVPAAVSAAIGGVLMLSAKELSDPWAYGLLLVAGAVLAGMVLAVVYGVGLLVAVSRARRARAAAAAAISTREALARGRRHPAFILARLGLAAIGAAGAWFAFERLAFTIEEVRHGSFADDALNDQKLRDTLLGEVSAAVATMNFDAAILEAIGEEDMQRAEVLHGLAGSLGRSIAPTVEQRYQEAISPTATAWRWARDAAAGALTGQSASLAGLAGAIAADVGAAPLGDIRDAGIQLYALTQGQETDEIILGLAVLGIALYTIDHFSNENLTGVKAGQATIKAGLRFSKASAHLSGDLRRVVGNAVDMPGLKAWARTSFNGANAADATRFVKRGAFDEIGQVADHVKTIYDTGGGSAVLVSLQNADSVADLARFRRVSRVLGDDAEKAFVVLGKRMQRAFKVWQLSAPAVAKVAAWFSALAASVTLLLASVFQSVALKLARIGVLRGFALWLGGSPQKEPPPHGSG